jgi:hypothetical protein
MRMQSPRTIGVAACALVIAGWLLGSTLSPPVALSEQPARTTASRPESLPAIAPLHDLRVGERPSPPAPARNPFAFDAPRRDAAATGARADEPRAAEGGPAVEEAAAPEYPWRLSGIAVDAEGTVTAVVSGGGDVHLVRAGDRLPDGTLVVAASATGVQLRAADGGERVLRLP